MKTFKITSMNQPSVVQSVTGDGKTLNEITVEGADDLQVSDGYHTMDELYEHRIILFITLLRILHHWSGSRTQQLWCSKYHSDGTWLDGWFVAGIGREPGKQITYHLPVKYWDEVIKWAEYESRAPEWDGHTSADVLERLKKL